MTAETAVERLVVNLELLRDATRTDAAFHVSLDTESSAFVDVQVARGMLATGNPEQLRGQSLEALPWLKTRLASLRVSEIRDTVTRVRIKPRTARSGPTSASARCW